MRHYIHKGIYIVYSFQERLEDYCTTYEQLNKRIFKTVMKEKKFIHGDGMLWNFVSLCNKKEYVVCLKSTLSKNDRIVVLADSIMKDIKPEDIKIEILN